MRRTLLITCAILTCIASKAQIGGTTVFNFLNIPTSARMAGAGGNLNAVNDGDLSLGIYNPSLLDSNVHRNVSLSYLRYFAGTNFGFASYAHQIDSTFTAAAAVQYYDYGNVARRDENGRVEGLLDMGDFSAQLSLGMVVDSSFKVGASLKFIYSALGGYYSYGAAADVAVTYVNPRRKLSATLMLRNLGYQLVAFNEDNREKLPFDVQFGFAKELKHAPFRFSVVLDNLQQWDLTYTNPNEPVQVDPITGEVEEQNTFEFGDKLMRHVILGGEILVSENFEVRFGYNYRTRQEMKIADRPGTAGFSWGFTLKIQKFNLGYGRYIQHLAGPSNTFTIIYAIPGGKSYLRSKRIKGLY